MVAAAPLEEWVPVARDVAVLRSAAAAELDAPAPLAREVAVDDPVAADVAVARGPVATDVARDDSAAAAAAAAPPELVTDVVVRGAMPGGSGGALPSGDDDAALVVSSARPIPRAGTASPPVPTADADDLPFCATPVDDEFPVGLPLPAPAELPGESALLLADVPSPAAAELLALPPRPASEPDVAADAPGAGRQLAPPSVVALQVSAEAISGRPAFAAAATTSAPSPRVA